MFLPNTLTHWLDCQWTSPWPGCRQGLVQLNSSCVCCSLHPHPPWQFPCIPQRFPLAQPHSPQFLAVFSMFFNFYALLLTCICAYPHFSTALSRAHQQSEMCFPLCLLPTFYSRFVNDLTLHIVFYSWKLATFAVTSKCVKTHMISLHQSSIISLCLIRQKSGVH